jgi:phosphotransferase system HPr-like phosphotransfer protein
MVLGLEVCGSEEVVLYADGNGAELALNKLADLVRDLDALGHD